MHQGMLRLDQPYKKPTKSALPFSLCQQYQQCTCCNASHVLAIHRSLQVVDSEPMSDACYAMTAQLACRPCDPEVGMGLKERVCLQTCQNWLHACHDDYFSYNGLSQALEPCGTKAASAVCSQARQLADDGMQFCTMAGLHVSQEAENCFDGSAVPMYDSCVQPRRQSAVRTSVGDRQLAVPKLGWLLAVAGVLFLLYVQVRRVLFRLSSQGEASKRPAVQSRSPYFRGKGRKLTE